MEAIELRERLKALAREHLSTFEETYGYPPGENVIEAASTRENAVILATEFGSKFRSR